VQYQDAELYNTHALCNGKFINFYHSNHFSLGAQYTRLINFTSLQCKHTLVITVVL